MKSFRNFIAEEVLPSVQVADGSLDISKPAVRAAINAAIAGVVSQPAVTPYVVFNRLSKLLAQYHIVLPKRFLEGDKGVEVFELKQFGHRMGMTDSGEFINEVPTTHYLFLQYGILTPMGVTYAKPLVGGMFRVTARLVDKEELDKLLDMAEITMSEEAEIRQLAAKAMAPKEEPHTALGDCGCNQGKSPSTRKAIKVSMKKIDEDKDPCWKGYEMVGMKKKGGRKVPNCVPVKEEEQIDETSEKLRLAYTNKAMLQTREKEKKPGEHYKRAIGIHRAARLMLRDKKNVKEETLDELSQETLKSYRKKVEDQHLPRHDAKARKHTHGHTRAGRKLGMSAMDATIDTIEKTFTPKFMKNLGDRQKTARDSDKGFKAFKDRKRVDEVAPPDAKFERMVKHIKKGYSKDGLTDKEKSIAYATAWKAKKSEENK